MRRGISHFLYTRIRQNLISKRKHFVMCVFSEVNAHNVHGKNECQRPHRGRTTEMERFVGH